MTFQEKSLYHQIHPAKLFTDWSTGLIALVPFWWHNLLLALLIAFVSSIIVSIVLIRFADLEKYKQSAFGKYVKKYMTRTVEAMRFIGYGIMAVGAWVHVLWAIPIGLLIIILAWLRGVIFPGK